MCGSILCREDHSHGHVHGPLGGGAVERTEEGDCPICYHVPTEIIPLSCGHRIHASCLTSWWGKGTMTGLVCPLCRQCSYDCFMELKVSDNKPVGYFRQDTPNDRALLLRNKNDTDPTYVVRLQEDARDMGLTGFIFLMAEESPAFKAQLQSFLSEGEAS